MKVIIAGSRTIKDQMLVHLAVQRSGFEITELVNGKAPGVDEMAETWAHFYNVPIKYFPANWEAHGKAAGPIRNGRMAVYAHALIAVWDGKSPGTKDMLEKARRYGLKVYEHRVLPTGTFEGDGEYRLEVK